MWNQQCGSRIVEENVWMRHNHHTEHRILEIRVILDSLKAPGVKAFYDTGILFVIEQQDHSGLESQRLKVLNEEAGVETILSSNPITSWRDMKAGCWATNSLATYVE